MNLAEIGQVVRDRRKRLGLTQNHLAERTGISRATVNGLENGSLSELGFSRLAAILFALNIEITVSVMPSRRPTLDDRYASQREQALAKQPPPPYRG